MSKLINSALIPVIAGVLGLAWLPAKPASADLFKDAAVGAATNVVTGEILDNGKIVGNAVGGAAAGATVGATHNGANSRTSSLVQDAAVGAAATMVTGGVFNNGTTLKNALGGAATGVVVNVSRY